MMTIKEFAQLCNCNPQTLRYYDRIDLLKPVKVDEWTGYRYYEEKQALDFVKIKNMQLADFSIDEIKSLLKATDEEVQAAFERKVAEQESKLEQVREIYNTYLAEKKSMEKVLQGVMDFLGGDIKNENILRELSIKKEEAEQFITVAKEFLEKQMREALTQQKALQMAVNQEEFFGEEEILAKLQELGENDKESVSIDIAEEVEVEIKPSQVIFEKHGWGHVHEFLNEIPLQKKDKEYDLVFHFKKPCGFAKDYKAFALIIMGKIIEMNGGHINPMGLESINSEDELNHFWLKESL